LDGRQIADIDPEMVPEEGIHFEREKVIFYMPKPSRCVGVFREAQSGRMKT
jgi:hypothetical protein